MYTHTHTHTHTHTYTHMHTSHIHHTQQQSPHIYTHTNIATHHTSHITHHTHTHQITQVRKSLNEMKADVYKKTNKSNQKNDSDNKTKKGTSLVIYVKALMTLQKITADVLNPNTKVRKLSLSNKKLFERCVMCDVWCVMCDV